MVYIHWKDEDHLVRSIPASVGCKIPDIKKTNYWKLRCMNTALHTVEVPSEFSYFKESTFLKGGYNIQNLKWTEQMFLNVFYSMYMWKSHPANFKTEFFSPSRTFLATQQWELGYCPLFENVIILPSSVVTTSCLWFKEVLTNWVLLSPRYKARVALGPVCLHDVDAELVWLAHCQPTTLRARRHYTKNCSSPFLKNEHLAMRTTDSAIM